LVIAGIFAASMSSIDSAMNALSAATWRDFLLRQFPKMAAYSRKQMVRISRILTVIWGMIVTLFALHMIGGSETVIVLVNKIGSAFYGPVLAVFILGIVTRRANQAGAIIGLLAGVSVNIVLWQGFQDDISWLWWNPIGFFVSLSAGYAASRIASTSPVRPVSAAVTLNLRDIFSGTRAPRHYIILLLVAFASMILITYIVQAWLMTL
jgi:Na+/proline symporter